MSEPDGVWAWYRAGDPSIAVSDDSARSRERLVEARWDDPALDAERDRVLSLLDEHRGSLARRTTAPGHLTGSALVVDAACERVVVLMHTKLRRWLQPGGHADGDHELAGVALKEASEETGIDGLRVLVPAIDLDVHELDHGDELGSHLHLDLRFVVQAPPEARIVGNHESLELRWVTPDQLEELADEEGILRLARVGLAAARAASGAPDRALSSGRPVSRRTSSRSPRRSR